MKKQKDKQIKKSRLVSRLFSVCAAAVLFLAMAGSVSAADLNSSTIVTGTKQLLADVMTALTVLCPTVCGVFAIGFAIRRGMADEQDGKMWTRRITTAIVCGVAGGLISGAIALVASYYGG